MTAAGSLALALTVNLGEEARRDKGPREVICWLGMVVDGLPERVDPQPMQEWLRLQKSNKCKRPEVISRPASYTDGSRHWRMSHSPKVMGGTFRLRTSRELKGQTFFVTIEVH